MTWQERRLDCALPGACITDPSGGVHQGNKTSALYAGGAFYVGRFWSRDGDVWQLHGEPAPTRGRGAGRGNLWEAGRASTAAGAAEQAAAEVDASLSAAEKWGTRALVGGGLPVAALRRGQRMQDADRQLPELQS